MRQANLFQAAEGYTTRTPNLRSHRLVVVANPLVSRPSQHSVLAVAPRRLNETWTNVVTMIAIDPVVVAASGERVTVTTIEFDAKSASNMMTLLVAPKLSPNTPNSVVCPLAISVTTYRSKTSV